MAPQLTVTYGQYDNGNSVFLFYQTFNAQNCLSNGWYMPGGTPVSCFGDYIQVESNITPSGWYGIFSNTNLFNGSLAWDFYGNMYNNFSVGSAVGPTNGDPGNWGGYMWSEGNTTPNLIYLANGDEWTFNTGYQDTNSNKVYSMYIDGTYVNMLINYKSIFSTNSATPELTSTFVIAVNSVNNKTPTPISIYWLPTRALPPKGVMPSLVSFLLI